MVPTRLIIADDHPLVLLGLRRLLEDQLDWKVVAEAYTDVKPLIKPEKPNQTSPLLISVCRI